MPARTNTAHLKLSLNVKHKLHKYLMIRETFIHHKFMNIYSNTQFINSVRVLIHGGDHEGYSLTLQINCIYKRIYSYSITK